MASTDRTAIIFGLGSGRCGTKSLASLISLQDGAVCFHEINPSSMSWDNGFAAVRNVYRDLSGLVHNGDTLVAYDSSVRDFTAEFEKIERGGITIAGDVASYYLPYVEYLLGLDGQIKFPCLKRDKHETIESFVKKTRKHDNPVLHAVNALTRLIAARNVVPASRNHWIEHDGALWRRSPVWDKCFPKFDTDDLREAISLYWDAYYRQAEDLAARHPGNVRIFDIGALSDPPAQRDLLEFCGIENPRTEIIHENA